MVCILEYLVELDVQNITLKSSHIKTTQIITSKTKNKNSADKLNGIIKLEKSTYMKKNLS